MTRKQKFETKKLQEIMDFVNSKRIGQSKVEEDEGMVVFSINKQGIKTIQRLNLNLQQDVALLIHLKKMENFLYDYLSEKVFEAKKEDKSKQKKPKT